MKRLTLRALASLLALLLIIAPGSAHEIRPGYMEITEEKNGTIQILWKQPVTGETALRLEPKLSSDWLTIPPVAFVAREGALTRRWTIPAPHAPLEGQVITIDGLSGSLTDVLVRVTFRDGSETTHVIRPASPTWEIKPESGSGAPVRTYLGLGIEHILFGIDHLLFVLGLLLLVDSKRRLLKTITAFTVAHSITLALAALGIVHVPQSAVEAVIALSILFVAVEVVRRYQGQDNLTMRYPWVVAFVFGLLHGFGFAGALAEIGLPKNAIPLAMFLFNVGVEIGQLAFVGVVLALIRVGQWAAARLQWTPPQWLRWIPAYAIGTMAGYWFIERVALVFRG